MKRWKIVYDKYTKAVEKIHATLDAALPYVIVCGNEADDKYNTVYIGIDKNVKGFKIDVSNPLGDTQRIDIIAEDEINLLYAASDFRNFYLPQAKFNSGDNVVDFYQNDLFAGPLPPFHYATKPKIKQRGLWTWGYTIYDYKKYIDNMVTLKMNTLIIWNDFVPVNIHNVINYAHENGVKIYLGFAWGWDTNCEQNISDTSLLTKAVLEKYKSEYFHLPCDGIYFQSFTELCKSDIEGVNIAEAVTSFVNNTASEIYKIKPDLELLFGLHATSVMDKIDVFKEIDPRISIVWENVGATPYHNSPDYLENFDETIDLNLRLQSLRQGGFGAVLKSNYRLNWSTFEHQEGPSILGMADPKVLKNKLEEKKPMHKKIQADWIKNAPYAHKMIQDFNEDAMITVLAEDGIFENFISYPVALYAQMLWDSGRDISGIMHKTAQMPDVDFV